MNAPATHAESSRPVVPIIVALVAPLVFLLPFVDKAYHIDGPVFLWVAEQIQQHPLDFYGFDINWYGAEDSVAVVNMNPPLVSYVMALIAALFGWGEVTMHLAFLIPASGASLGVYLLARRFCLRPLLATLIVVVSPLFMLSASNVMAEITMLFFYVWAIVLWLHGLEKDRLGLLMVSAMCIVAAALSKYIGISLIPLLLVYTLMVKRKAGTWIAPLLFACVCLAGYELWTRSLYDRGHMFEAVLYAIQESTSQKDSVIGKLAIGLSFIGGCLIFTLFYSPLLWKRSSFLWGALLVGSLIALSTLVLMLSMGQAEEGPATAAARWEFVVQWLLFITAGVLIVMLTVSDLWTNRDAKSVMLFLWVFGIFLFAVLINWTISGRALLPMTPAVGIVVARRLDRQAERAPHGKRWVPFLPLVPTAAITLCLLWADYQLANSRKVAADYYGKRFDDHPQTVWYQGHWGWQWYIEEYDVQHTDTRGTDFTAGDLIVFPRWNTSTISLTERLVDPDSMEIEGFDSCRWLATWNRGVGAGFYSHGWGPVPYVFTKVQPEIYASYEVTYTGLVEPNAAR